MRRCGVRGTGARFAPFNVEGMVKEVSSAVLASMSPSSSKTSSRSASKTAAQPSELFGYEVIDFVGEGAGSKIYVVSDRETRQLYALKHVIRRTEKDIRFIEQVQNEYEVSRGFDHRGLRRSVDLKLSRSLLLKINEAALIMELIDGQPLDQRVPSKMIQVVDCFIKVADALCAMHAAGYVHCDLKPNNILLNSRGEVKVIDYGQACPPLTRKKRIQGTPDFISPEQVKLEPVSARTDVFNLGATLYWTLTGRKLPTLFTLKKQENSFLSDEHMASPRSINDAVPETLSNLVMECVKTSPRGRPDMSEVASRLHPVRHALRRQEQFQQQQPATA